MSTNLNAYVNYFRSLAVSHKDILHDPASEAGAAGNHKKGFTVFGNEEIISGIRTELKENVLGIELYETKLTGEVVYDIKQKPKGSLMVISNVKDVKNFNQVTAAYALSEEILYQMMQKIWSDHYGPEKKRCETPFKHFHFFADEIIPTGLVFDKYYGWYLQFDFEFQNSISISTPPADGIFS